MAAETKITEPEVGEEDETIKIFEEASTDGEDAVVEENDTDNNPDEASGEAENQASKDGWKSKDEEVPEQVKKSLFSKKEKKDKKDEKITELTDKLMRQMAEFENFRKRSEREKAQMFEFGVKDILEKILPTVDNFERGFAGLSEEELASPFVQGMDKVYKQLTSSLESAGVKPIEAVGKEFDPNLHNAIMHVDDEELGENIIAEEYQKGYTYHDTVIRHSMVKVAN